MQGERICRTCAKEEESVDKLTKLFSKEAKQLDLISKIIQHMPIKNLNENDLLPKSICDSCKQIILSWHSFWDFSRRIESQLEVKQFNYYLGKINNNENAPKNINVVDEITSDEPPQPDSACSRENKKVSRRSGKIRSIYCFARWCNNSNATKKMFRFPKDQRRFSWLYNCGREEEREMDVKKIRFKYICEDHFTGNMYVNGRLTRRAIPIIFSNRFAKCSNKRISTCKDTSLPQTLTTSVCTQSNLSETAKNKLVKSVDEKLSSLRPVLPLGEKSKNLAADSNKCHQITASPKASKAYKDLIKNLCISEYEDKQFDFVSNEKTLNTKNSIEIASIKKNYQISILKPKQHETTKGHLINFNKPINNDIKKVIEIKNCENKKSNKVNNMPCIKVDQLKHIGNIVGKFSNRSVLKQNQFKIVDCLNTNNNIMNVGSIDNNITNIEKLLSDKNIRPINLIENQQKSILIQKRNSENNKYIIIKSKEHSDTEKMDIDIKNSSNQVKSDEKMEINIIKNDLNELISDKKITVEQPSEYPNNSIKSKTDSTDCFNSCTKNKGKELKISNDIITIKRSNNQPNSDSVNVVEISKDIIGGNCIQATERSKNDQISEVSEIINQDDLLIEDFINTNVIEDTENKMESNFNNMTINEHLYLEDFFDINDLLQENSSGEISVMASTNSNNNCLIDPPQQNNNNNHSVDTNLKINSPREVERIEMDYINKCVVDRNHSPLNPHDKEFYHNHNRTNDYVDFSSLKSAPSSIPLPLIDQETYDIDKILQTHGKEMVEFDDKSNTYFDDLDNFIDHFPTKFEDPSFKDDMHSCPSCGESFLYKSRLSHHRRVYHSETCDD